MDRKNHRSSIRGHRLIILVEWYLSEKLFVSIGPLYIRNFGRENIQNNATPKNCVANLFSRMYSKLTPVFV